MQLNTLINDRIRKILPENGKKNIFFAAVTNTKYEIFFYTMINEVPIQCYELAEKGLLDGSILDEVFEDLAGSIRRSDAYDKERLNIVTIKIDQEESRIDFSYEDRDARMYSIKKTWKKNNL